MSYVTQKCTACNGSSRIHITTTLECSLQTDCGGCIRCRDCIDGRTAGSGANSIANKHLVRVSVRGSEPGSPRMSRVSRGSSDAPAASADGNVSDEAAEPSGNSKRPSVVTSIKQAFKRGSTLGRTPLSAAPTLTSNESPVLVSQSDALPSNSSASAPEDDASSLKQHSPNSQAESSSTPQSQKQPDHTGTDDVKHDPRELPSLPSKEISATESRTRVASKQVGAKASKTTDIPENEEISAVDKLNTPISPSSYATGNHEGIKKQKRLTSVNDLPDVPAAAGHSQMSFTSTENGFLSYSAVSLGKGKGFKEWYTAFVNYSSQRSAAASMRAELTFPITLDEVFGKKSTIEYAEPFFQSTRCSVLYDTLLQDDKEGFAARYPSFVGRAEKELLKGRFETRYRPLDIFEDKLPKSCVVVNDSNGERIASGPAEALIDALIFPLNQDMSYAEVFLTSFRFFMEAPALFNSLIEWYNVDLSPENQTNPASSAFLKKSKRPIQVRVIKVLLLWIKNHWHDFHTSGLLLNSLLAFVDYANEVSFGDGQRLDQTVREQRLAWYTNQYMPAFPPRRANGGSMTGNEIAANFLSIDSDETLTIARELSLIDLFYARQIRPDAYFDVLSRPVLRKYGGRNSCLRQLMEQQKWCRMMSLYIIIVFLKEPSKSKSKVLKRVIKLTQTLFELQSFNLVYVFVRALESPSISRAFSAWETLNVKHVEVFRKLQDFTNPAHNHANYWAIVGQIDTPIIPYLPPYIHDLMDEYDNGLESHPHLFKYAPKKATDDDASSVDSAPRLKRSGPTRKRNYKVKMEEPVEPVPALDSGVAKPADSKDELTKEDQEYLQVEFSDFVPTFEVNFEVFHNMYSVAAELEYWLRGPNDYAEYGLMKEVKLAKDRLPELFTHIRDVCTTGHDAASEAFSPYP